MLTIINITVLYKLELLRSLNCSFHYFFCTCWIVPILVLLALESMLSNVLLLLNLETLRLQGLFYRGISVDISKQFDSQLRG